MRELSCEHSLHLEPHSYWLIGIDLCLYTSLALPELAPALRKNYIHQRVQQLSPFKETAYYSFEQAGTIQVWLWDKSAEAEVGDHERKLGVQFKVVPEQLFLSSVEQGLVNRQTEQYSLLEYWRSGALLASSLVDTASSADQRQNFVEGLGLEGELPSGGWQELEFSRQPYPRDWVSFWSKSNLTRPRVFNTLLLSLCLMAVAFVAGQSAGWYLELEEKKTAMESQFSQLQPLLVQREKTLGMMTVNKAREALIHRSSLILVAAEFEYLVGSLYEEMLEWNLDRGNLQTVLKDKTINSRAYLEALERSPLFESVKVQPDIRPDAISIQAQVMSGSARVPVLYTEPATEREVAQSTTSNKGGL